MRVTIREDVNAMGIHLYELKSLFNQAVRDQRSIEDIKSLYMQIEQLETEWKSQQWNPGSPSLKPKRISGARKYPHIDEPSPLL
jgi:hypothetical protein